MSGGVPFDPMRCAGAAVRVAVALGDDDEKGLQDKRAELRQETGIEMEVTGLPLRQLIDATPGWLAAPVAPYDIVAVLGFNVPAAVGGGGFERLNDYLADPARTPPDYDFADFPAGQLRYCGYFDVEARAYGGGDLYLVPGIHSGSCIYYFRTDVLDRLGAAPAATWDDYRAIARAAHGSGLAGNTLVGRAELSLLTVEWYSRFVTTGGVMTTGSPGGRDFRPNLLSDEAVAALQMVVDLVRLAPEGVTDFRWEDSVAAMAGGRAAQMLMWTTSAGAVFDPEVSEVTGRVGTALVPAAPGHRRRAVRGGFGLGIPANSASKEAAWRVLTYITSKSFNRYQTARYRSDPNRLSTFADPDLVRLLPHLPVAARAYEAAQIMEAAAAPEFFDLKDVANRCFHEALEGRMTARAACAEVQDAWAQAFAQAGWLRPEGGR